MIYIKQRNIGTRFLPISEISYDSKFDTQTLNDN